MDEELRDWIRGLAEPGDRGESASELSDEAADYLAGIAVDGTLSAALAELGEHEPELLS